MAKEQTKTIRIPLTGDWYLGTDGISFLLIKRREVKAGRQTKPENIGNERFETMGYYSSLRGLVSGLERYLAVDTLMHTEAKTLNEYIGELKELVDQVDRVETGLINQLVDNLGVNE